MSQNIIDHLQLHVPVSQQSACWLKEHAKSKKLAKGSLLRLHTDDLAFISEGLLMKVKEEQVYHFIPNTDFIIYPALEEDYSFVALEQTVLQYISREALLQLLAQDSFLLQGYHRLLSYWAVQRMQRAELLQLPAPQRKEAFYRRFRHLASRVPSKWISSYLCISPSYFSRL